MPQSTLSRILSGKIVDPSDKHISRIADYFRVSTDQLRGRAALVASREDERDPMHSELKDISLWDDDTPVNDDEVSIPFLREVELAAGSGRFVIEESEKASLRFGKRSLRHNGVQFDQAKCVTVRGNSMLPVLRDGATVGSMPENAGLATSSTVICTPSITTASCGSSSSIACLRGFACAASIAMNIRTRTTVSRKSRKSKSASSVTFSGGACTPVNLPL